MEVLRTIAFYTEGKDMPFVLIGGHAVNAHGFARQTGDINLLVRKSGKDHWHELLLRLGYKANQSDDRFARFSTETLAAWPIDLMFVDDQTFAKIFEDSADTEIGTAHVRLASSRHLAILKIHALKHYQEHRFLKDYGDLSALLRSKKTGITKEELKTLCEKYATIELYAKLINDVELT